VRPRIRYLLAYLALGCGTHATPMTPAPIDGSNAKQPEASANPSVTKESAEGPSPKADMSKQLGGIRLGMTVEELTLACKSAQGTITRVSEIDVACSVAPEALHGEGGRASLGGSVAAKFCSPGATACELVYVIEGDALKSDEQTRGLVTMLVGKYGPPSSAEGLTGDDPMTVCRRDRAAHFKRTWSFGLKQTPPHPTASVKLVFSCDRRVSEAARSLTLVYDDENGMRYRSADTGPTPHENF
jgi:hypothetical protein